LFKEVAIDDYLKEDAWVAGGFPRLISKHINTNAQKTLKDVYKYFYNMGDIDVFSASLDKVNNIQNVITKRLDKERRKIDSNDFFVVTEAVRNENYYELPFTFNHENNLDCLKALCAKNNVNKEDMGNDLDFSVIQTQFVNKFIFKDIKECFDNFDLANTKIAISLKEGEYYLHYTDSAEFYNSKNVLKIDKVESPYLSNRITKYTRKYMFEIDDNKDFRNHIKDYLYKVVQGKWPDIYQNTFEPERAIKSLHTNITLSSEDLCLFLGMFTHLNRIKSSYGVFTSQSRQFIELDWATHHIGLLNGR
jgi:hypothetical protein